MRPSLPVSGLLFLILVLEVLVFSPNFGNFYCGDSLFWFSTTVQSWEHLLRLFSSIDGLDQYRPLTFVFYTYVVHPIAGMSIFRQHLFPFIFHAINTLLVYYLSLRVFADPRKALISAFFFGVSATAAYITYDNTCLPDYLYVVLYLSAMLLLSLRFETGKALFGVLGFLAFLGALLSKEAGVTFPAAGLIYLLLSRKGEKSRLVRRVIANLLPMACICAGYVGWHLWRKGGALYPSNPSDPHSLHLSIATLQSKIPFALQALGLPRISVSGWPESLGYALLCLFIGWAAVRSVVGLWRRKTIYWGGLTWAAITLAPALLILANSWEQNMYLPLVGISWVLSQALDDLAAQAPRFRFPVLYVPVLLAYTWAVSENALVARTSSWMAGGSRVTESCLRDLQRMYPYIPHDTLIYVETNLQKNIVWHFDSGNLASTFYGDRSIRMRFSDDGLPPPEDALIRSRKVIVLKYLEGRLYDVTTRRRLEAIDRDSYRLRSHWEEGTVVVNAKEFSAANQPARFVFPYESGLADSGRDTLVIAAGASYIHPIASIAPGSRLRFGVAAFVQNGTVLNGELLMIRPDGTHWPLYSRRFSQLPVEARGWEDRTLALAGIAGPGYKLKLTVGPVAEARDGDSLQWGPLEIVPPGSQSLEDAVNQPPVQPSGVVFRPARIKRGDAVSIEALGGASMEIDCQYSLNSRQPESLNNWLVTDEKGIMRVKVDTPGHYVITAIRNSRRQDWVPVHAEFECD